MRGPGSTRSPRPAPGPPTAPAELPPGVRRLVGDPPPDPDLHRDHLLARVLQEGDSADLAWLVARFGEAELARVAGERGGRLLSRRTRAFWALVLGVEPSPEHPLTSALWPL